MKVPGLESILTRDPGAGVGGYAAPITDALGKLAVGKIQTLTNDALGDIGLRNSPRITRGINGVLEGGVANIGSTLPTLGVELLNGLANKRLNSLIGKDNTLGRFVKHLGLHDLISNKFGSLAPVEPNLFDQVSSLPDPLQDWEFAVIMPDINGNGVSAKAIPSHYIEDIDIPLDSLDAETIRINARENKVAGFLTLGTASITFFEGFKSESTYYLSVWKNCVINTLGQYNLPYRRGGQGYCKTITVILLNGGSPVALIQLVGCFPTDRTGYTLSGSGSDRLKNTQSFSVNRVLYIPLPTT